jgi:hypothetical protein
MFIMSVLCGTTSLAQVSGIYVEFYHSSNPFDGWAAVGNYPSRHGGFPDWEPEPGLPSGSSVQFTNSVAGRPYRVFATSPSTTDIGDITVTSSSTAYLTVGRFIDRQTPPATLPLDSAGARDLGSVSTTNGDKLVLQTYLLGDQVGSIAAWHIVRLDVDGALGDYVLHWGSQGSSTPAIEVIVAGSIGASATITANNGDIGAITASGDIDATIAALAGDIDGITSIAGGIAGDINASGSIGDVKAAVNITGDVAAGPGGHIWWINAPNGDIGATGGQNWVTIGAGTLIQKIYAENIYARIESTSAAGCSVERVIAYDGVFEGSIDALKVHDIDGNQDDEGVVRGKTGMSASIVLSGDIKEAVQVLDGDFVGVIECESLTGDTGDENFSGYSTSARTP